MRLRNALVLSFASAAVLASAALGGCSLVNAPDDVKAGAGGGGGGPSGAGGGTTTNTTTTTTTTTTGAGGSGGTMCAAGTADCDGNPANGCESLESADHCGTCDKSCSAADMHVATPVCSMGACDYDACTPGFGDCDGDHANGCELDLSKDAANCGACANACAQGATCQGGICCATGTANCDGDPGNGCEIAALSDPANCGGCGNACPQGQTCSGGTCQQFRPNLMLCGSSSRDVKTFLPPGVSLNLVQGCAPDASTQAIIVTRSFGGQINAMTFQAYLNGGGVALTEYSISDDVYSLAFGATAQAGTSMGSCQDVAPTVAQFSPNDPFWAANPFMSIPLSDTGCGYPVQGFPGITPLAGWDANNAAIGYRDLGAGRLWVTDFDWQDGDTVGAAYAYTNQLMGYMITHAK